MKFWDSSAIVPLCLDEDVTKEVRRIIVLDSSITVWWASRIECISAIIRRVREGNLNAASENQSKDELSFLAKDWHEIKPSETVRSGAENMITRHILRAADALQLAAAILWAQNHPVNHHFVSFDKRLRDAAHKEGFILLPEVI